MPLPVLFKLRSGESFIVAVCGVAIFTDLFLYGIIVPVLPYALPTRFSIEESQVQTKLSTLLAIYAAALLAACPVAGYVADRTHSRRVPFLAGLWALVGSTVIFTVARTYWLLIVGRILQGLSAAVVWTVGLALLVDTVGKDRLGIAMGTVTIFMGSAMALAPVLGGVLYDVGGYYAPFYLCFALLLLDIFLRLMIIEKKTAKLLLQQEYSTERDREKTPATPLVSAATIRVRYNLPPVIRLLKVPRILAGCWIGFCASLILSSFDAVLPLHVENLWGFNSLGAGLIFIALVIPSFVVSPIGGWIIDTRGTKGITLLGVLLEVPFLVVLRFPNSTSPRVGQIVLMCVLLVLNGSACALFMPAAMVEIAHIVDIEEQRKPGLFGKQGAYAQAYALFNVAYSLGCLVGPLVAGSIRDSAGWATMCWSLALFVVICIPVVLLIVGGSVRDTHWIRRDPKLKATDEEKTRRPTSETTKEIQVHIEPSDSSAAAL